MRGVEAALLVIDVQRVLFEKSTPIFRADQLLDAIGVLVAKARAAGAWVVYIQHCHPKLMPEDSEGWQLHPRLDPQPGDLHIRKHHGSAFEDTALAEELSRRGISTVVLCGLVTHGCVKATALDACKRGYATTVVADAHSSYSREASELIETWNARFAGQGIRVQLAAEMQF